MQRFYFDGGARPNPGMMEIGVVVEGGEKHRRKLGYGTNNLAEWQAILWAVEIAKGMGLTVFEVCGDSQLICKQALGEYRVKDAALKPFKVKFDNEIKGLQVIVTWTRRANNQAGWMLED